LGDIPTDLIIQQGEVEVASFSRKKWLRCLSDRVILVKKIQLPENFAIE